MMPCVKTHAFTLVELSIVLVILGLLTGGILTGQSLIRAAEIRSITTQFSQYQTAIQSFRDRYQAYPGDMKNATKFWGDDAAACPDAAVPDGTPGTCNGDGDGKIEPGPASATSQMFQFWKQLALAGLIEGSYTGLAGSSSQHHIAGTNAPTSKISNTSWRATEPPSAGDGDLYEMTYGESLEFGQIVANSAPYGAILRPEEAWNIDIKIDDGRPAFGKIIARYWHDKCAVADDGTHAKNDLNASYKLSDSSIQCALYFRNLF